eukprot:8334351-Alexandrium_andersonii.AAC.1
MDAGSAKAPDDAMLHGAVAPLLGEKGEAIDGDIASADSARQLACRAKRLGPPLLNHVAE